MVENVEDLSAELKAQFLREFRVFEDREVDVVITGPAQGVATERSEMPRSGNARSGTAVTRRIERARHLESSKVDELVRRVCAGVRITDEIGSRKKLPRVVVIIKQRQVERISAADRHNRVQLPTVAETRVRLRKVWQCVS